MALTLSAQASRLLVPASAAHNTLAAFTVGQWFRGGSRTNGARLWSKTSSLRLASQGTTGDIRSVMDVVEAPPDIFNATSSGLPAPGGTTWWCLIVEQSLADGVRIYVGDETTLPAEVTYADRTAGDPLLTVTDDSADQFRFGGTGVGASQTQAGDYSYCMRLNRVATAQEREDWWRTLALPTDGSVLGDWRPGENGLIDVPDHGPLGLDLVLSGTITVTGADPTLPGPAGTTVSQSVQAAVESLARPVASLASAIESLGAVAAAPAVAVESLTTASAAVSPSVESLHGLAAATTPGIESLGHVVRALTAPWTAEQGVDVVRLVPWESLALVSAAQTAPVESLVTVAAGSLSPLEILARVARAITAPLEASGTAGAVSASVVAAIEWLQGISAARVASLESLSPVTAATPSAVEVLAGVSRGDVAAIEGLALAARALSAPWESLGRVSRSQPVAWESLATLLATQGTSIEVLRSVRQTQGVAVEALLRLAVLSPVPLESLGLPFVSRILRELDRSGHRLMGQDLSAHRVADTDHSAPHLTDLDRSGVSS